MRSVSLFAITVLAMSIIFSASTFAIRPASAASLCVNPGGTGGCFSSIQAAINAANSSGGDTINVADGTYHEVIWIQKPLTLISASGAANTFIDGTGLPQPRQAVVMISASNVVFGTVGHGFTILGAGAASDHPCTDDDAECWDILITSAPNAQGTPTYTGISIEGNTLPASWPDRALATAGGVNTANVEYTIVRFNDIHGGAYIDIGTGWDISHNTLYYLGLVLTGDPGATGSVTCNLFLYSQVSFGQNALFAVHNNAFVSTGWDGYDIVLYGPTNSVDATENYWGTNDPAAIQKLIGSYGGDTSLVDYTPWSTCAECAPGSPAPCPVTTTTVVAVGGFIESVNKLAVLAPWLAVIGLVGCISTVVIVAKKRR